LSKCKFSLQVKEHISTSIIFINGFDDQTLVGKFNVYIGHTDQPL